MENKIILAIIGMPGSGKSEAVKYLQQKNLPFIRFGDLTEDELRKHGLAVTPENEKVIREKIREENGMDAFARLAQPKIDEALKNSDSLVIDGLYSWEEYVYLKNQYPSLLLIHIYARPDIRYTRLAEREIRPIKDRDQARKRDIAEIENLHKGGPIAVADYMVENNENSISALHEKLDTMLAKINLKND